MGHSAARRDVGRDGRAGIFNKPRLARLADQWYLVQQRCPCQPVATLDNIISCGCLNAENLPKLENR